jgi:16S rRNA (guanine527-N7)-methyltransferase
MENGLSQQNLYQFLLSIYPNQAKRLSEAFETYLKMLIEVNKVMNLTAIDQEDAVREKHFMDCLLIEPLIPKDSSVADIGSGAGFPGLCLAIVREDCQFDLIEPTGKRCQFLNQVIQALKLSNVRVLNRRAEECLDLKERYDVVTSRAVAKLSILMELSIPLLKVKGKMIAMKGSSAQEEIEEAKNAIQILKLSDTIIYAHSLPTAGQRMNLEWIKLDKSPSQYPRAYSQIKKKAL